MMNVVLVSCLFHCALSLKLHKDKELPQLDSEFDPEFFNEKDDEWQWKNGFPNIMSVFDYLPQIQDLPRLEKRNDEPVKLAVCSAGHLRTFIFPGVHTSWKRYLFEPNSNSKLFSHFHEDCYSIGTNSHKGENRCGAYGNITETFINKHGFKSQREAADAAVKTFGNNVGHANFNNDGTCKSLQAVWESKGITRKCYENPNFLQVMWMDACFQEAREHGPFDYYVRIRPDVALFDEVDFSKLKQNKVNVFLKDHSTTADWFFVVPSPVYDKYWPMITNMYANGDGGWLDYRLKHFRDDAKFYTQFPAVIVRNTAAEKAYYNKDAECFRIMDKTVRGKCNNATDAGHFNEYDHTQK